MAPNTQVTVININAIQTFFRKRHQIIAYVKKIYKNNFSKQYKQHVSITYNLIQYSSLEQVKNTKEK